MAMALRLASRRGNGKLRAGAGRDALPLGAASSRDGPGAARATAAGSSFTAESTLRAAPEARCAWKATGGGTVLATCCCAPVSISC
eukprot:scaffold6613_cov111-Isochrysis_galbana.AAC.3